MTKMTNREILKSYANAFNYRRVLSENNQEQFLKKVDSGFIVFESDITSKYVDFYFNENKKTFRTGDLMLALVESFPIAWEEEDDRY